MNPSRLSKSESPPSARSLPEFSTPSGGWQAHWIGLKTAETGASAPCPFLRRAFEVSGPVRRAVLYWSALGVGELWLSGQRIGTSHLSPGWSDYRHRVQAMSHDVTSLLKPGANMAGAVLGDGWYCGHLLWTNERNQYGEHPQLLFQLEMELESGEIQTVVSDSSWTVRTGPILRADLYHGETHDARRDLPGWCEPTAQGDGWHPANVFPDYPGVIQPKRNEPIEVTEERAPESLTEISPGRWIADFGQNLVGVCRLRLRGESGQEITLRFAEMLQADGSPYLENLRKAEATDRYICRGGGSEEWTPRFTFHGFRYAEITGLREAPSQETLTAIVLHSAMRPTGSFECSHPLVNRLHQNIRWGLRGNFLDVPTDCPQRDERLGWTGDAQIFVGTAAFHYDVNRFFQKWMFDLTDGQREDGAFPVVAPDLLSKEAPEVSGAAAWGDAGVICPWIIYQHYGDDTILRESYAAMVRWIDYQESTARGFLRPPTIYGDWLAIDAVTPQNAPVPSDLIGTAYFARTTRIMEQVAKILGNPADALRFRTLAAKITKAFRHSYVTPAGRIVGDCQTAYALALEFDLLPAKLRPAATERLVELIATRDWHLTTGFVGTPLLCPALSLQGRTDVAYRLLLQETYPSWLYTVLNGATTMWERWNSYTKEHGFGPVEMNSFNHYAYGAIGEWLYSVIGGIRSLAPGFRKILIAPEPGDGIQSARTALDSPAGRIECAWSLENGTLHVETLVPKGVRAYFQPPSGFPGGRRRLAAGRATFQVPLLNP